MNTTESRRRTCRLCGSRDLDMVLQLAPTPLADAYVPSSYVDRTDPVYPLDLFLCAGCGHVQLLDVIQPQLIYREYIYETASSLGLVDHFRGYAEEVVHRIAPRPGGFVIDIGSNDGALLRFFQQAGLRVLGIDPAREIARKATAAGIETLPEFFTVELAKSVRESHGPAAIITANNLFANVDDVDDMMAGVRHVLAPDGVFIFESFYLLDLIQNLVFDFIYHEHLSYFSLGPVVGFFRQHGMEVIDVQRVPTKGGSLRYTVQLRGGPRPVDGRVGALLAEESQRGLARIETFRAFGERIDAARSEVVDLLTDLRGQGKKIDGFGASATTTTFLYHFGLTDVVGCLIDENRAKQGLFSPGAHIPVHAPTALYERAPDYTLIIAWRYAEPIIAKHEMYRQKGGRFIIPLPRVALR